MSALNRAPVFRLPPWKCEATYRAEELAEVVDWSLAAYKVPDQWKQTKGQGVKVAVLDTGIDTTHRDLATAIDAIEDFTGSRTGPVDHQGHGTHTAGTIAARQNGVGVIGVAPECRLLIGKVLGDDGSGGPDSVAAGIHWAVGQGADIISMSLGSPQASPEIYAAIQAAAAAGKFIICAAGNDGDTGTDDIGYPARWSECVAVGAVDENGQVAFFSSRGPELAVAAPGVNILSTFLNGGYARLSGTSMATPFVAGVVALMLAKHRATGGKTPLASVNDLREHLAKTADDAGPAGRDPAYGWGLIDPTKLLAEDDPAPAVPTTDVPLLTMPATLVFQQQVIQGVWTFGPASAGTKS
jgi:subtilisin family serine protease